MYVFAYVYAVYVPALAVPSSSPAPTVLLHGVSYLSFEPQSILIVIS